ncbi:hypothetical protein VTJ04DRAFT_1195 [Mycothermus thermophilus]|uniref:uncharacterized protein n=1 Tax=Humicola insolens TaxID=85995 RepID=UPI003743DFC3
MKSNSIHQEEDNKNKPPSPHLSTKPNRPSYQQRPKHRKHENHQPENPAFVHPHHLPCLPYHVQSYLVHVTNLI